MGRAFPELQMTTFHISGISITPMAISDEKGNTIFVDSVDNEYGEWFARGVTRLMGGYSWISCYAMTGKELKRAAIRNTLSKAMKIGEILLSDSPLETKLKRICEFTEGRMQKGKVERVRRMKFGKFYGGEAEIVGEERSKIVFQNEYLMMDNEHELVSVPDIITLLDSFTLRPITTEEIRPGMNVFILTIPSDKKWKTKRGLEVVGPEMFGLNGDRGEFGR
jgi:hypothetical protein